MAKGRELSFQAVHYLRKRIAYTDGASAVVTVGTLPAGALVVGGAVTVLTAFNAGTNNNIDVGVAADPDDFATAIAMTSAGRKVFDEMATANDLLTTADTDVIATLGLTGTAASAGSAIIDVQYVLNNDR